MRKLQDIRSAAFSDGLLTIERWLERNCPAAVSLPPSRLKKYEHRDVVAGWSIAIEFVNGATDIHLLIDGRFPRSLPQVGLADPPGRFVWPHVQDDGVLCLFPESAIADSNDPSSVVQHVIGHACELVDEISSGKRQQDFLDEFLSYWGRAAESGTRILSLVAPIGPSREISVWRGADFNLVADSDEAVRQWLQNYSRGDKAEARIEKGRLLWRSTPLMPAEYPSSPADVMELARHIGEEQPLLESINNSTEKFVILFGMESNNGPCFAGTVIMAPDGRHSRGHQSLEHGFRAGKAPQKVISRRFVQGGGLTKSIVERVDAEWIHGRGRDKRIEQLRDSSVAVLGCGSIGSTVAMLLAQSGVGSLTLVDPQCLASANIGRHALGGRELGSGKAKSLSLRLKSQLPHLKSVIPHSARWQEIPLRTEGLMKSVNLIVSTIGHWADEAELNEDHIRNGRKVPIVYGWTEPYACAGHAVAVHQNGGCLNCGFSSSGQAHFRVAKFPSSTVLSEPACGTVYQPYGMVDLMHTCTLIAELVLDCLLDRINDSTHRIWAGSESLIKDNGGDWTEEWQSFTAGGVVARIQTERLWRTSAECPQCRSAPTV